MPFILSFSCHNTQTTIAKLATRFYDPTAGAIR